MNAVKLIEDNRKGQFAGFEDAKWFAVCSEHSSLIGVNTKKDAAQVSLSEFCADCQEAN